MVDPAGWGGESLKTRNEERGGKNPKETRRTIRNRLGLGDGAGGVTTLDRIFLGDDLFPDIRPPEPNYYASSCNWKNFVLFRGDRDRGVFGQEGCQGGDKGHMRNTELIMARWVCRGMRGGGEGSFLYLQLVKREQQQAVTHLLPNILYCS